MDRLSYPEKLVILYFWQMNKPLKTSQVILGIPNYSEGTIRHSVYALKSKGLLGITKDTECLKKDRKYYPLVSKEEYLYSLLMSYEPDVNQMLRLFKEGK